MREKGENKFQGEGNSKVQHFSGRGQQGKYVDSLCMFYHFEGTRFTGIDKRVLYTIFRVV